MGKPRVSAEEGKEPQRGTEKWGWRGPTSGHPELCSCPPSPHAVQQPEKRTQKQPSTAVGPEGDELKGGWWQKWKGLDSLRASGLGILSAKVTNG